MGPGSVWTQTPTAAPANPHYVRRQLQRSQPQASSQALRSLVHARNQPQEAAGQPHTQSAERLPRARRRQQCQLSSVVCSSHSNSNGSAVPPPSSRRDYWAVLSVILVGCLVFRFGSARAPGVVLAALQATAGPVARKGASGFSSSAWAGLFAGCLHSLSGPDHLAALTPLTVGRGQLKATFLGALWGFGHCIGQLVLGLGLLLLKEQFHDFVPALSKYSSLTVACTLIVIGVLGLKEVWEEAQHPDTPPAVAVAGLQGNLPGVPEELPSMAPAQLPQQLPEGLRGRSSFWTLATGLVYGLQPDALFVVIPALALPTRLAAGAYMLMFVVGTMAAMGGYTAVIGVTSKAIKKNNATLLSKLAAVASCVAIAVGLGLLVPSLQWV